MVRSVRAPAMPANCPPLAAKAFMSNVSVLRASMRSVLAIRSTSSAIRAWTLALLSTEDLATPVETPVLTDSAAVLLSPDCWPLAWITTTSASMVLRPMPAIVTGRSTLSATVPAAAAPMAPKLTAAATTWLSVEAALVAVSSKEPAVLTDERLPKGASIQASVRVSMVLTDLAPPPAAEPPMLASMATAATVDLDLMVASSLALSVTSSAALITA